MGHPERNQDDIGQGAKHKSHCINDEILFKLIGGQQGKRAGNIKANNRQDHTEDPQVKNGILLPLLYKETGDKRSEKGNNSRSGYCQQPKWGENFSKILLQTLPAFQSRLTNAGVNGLGKSR